MGIGNAQIHLLNREMQANIIALWDYSVFEGLLFHLVLSNCDRQVDVHNKASNILRVVNTWDVSQTRE